MATDFNALMNRKVHGIPVPVIAIAIGGGIGIIVLLRKRNSGSVPELDVDPQSLVSVTRTQPGYIPTPVPQFDTGGTPAPVTPVTPPAQPPVQHAPEKPSSPAPAKSGNTGPAKPNGPLNPQNPRQDVPKPAPAPARAPQYPGLPAGYQLNCAATYKGLHGDYNAVKATQLRKTNGKDGLFIDRNMSAIACYGTPTPWLGRGDWSNPSSINTRRVAYGLYPLTTDEIGQMINEINSYSARGETNAHSRELFERWNRPYQCSAGQGPRRERQGQY